MVIGPFRGEGVISEVVLAVRQRSGSGRFDVAFRVGHSPERGANSFAASAAFPSIQNGAGLTAGTSWTMYTTNFADIQTSIPCSVRLLGGSTYVHVRVTSADTTQESFISVAVVVSPEQEAVLRSLVDVARAVQAGVGVPAGALGAGVEDSAGRELSA